MPARWSRTHSSAKILSMKRSSRVSFVSQCTTSLSECAVTESMFGGAFISCSGAVTWMDDAGYVVFPLDSVNGDRRDCAHWVDLGSPRIRRASTQRQRRDLP